MHKVVTKILFSHEEIVKRVKELGNWINQNYTNEDNLLLIVILKGSLPFAAELIKHVTVDHMMDFMVISTYKGTSSVGEFKLVLDINETVKNRKIIIIEDIIDTGYTIKNLKNLLYTRKPSDIKVMTLLSKTELHEKSLEPDVVGFNIKNHFVVGFGFDYYDKYRNLPYIGIFNKKFI